MQICNFMSYTIKFVGSLLLVILISWESEAQLVFEKKFNPSLQQYGRELFHTADHGYFLQGTIEQGYKNCYLIKTNLFGDTLWTKTFGTDSIQFYTHDMAKTPDGGYVMSGDFQTVLTSPSMDSYVQKIDSMGNQVWFNLFGWPVPQNGNKDYAEMVKALDNGSVIVEGTTKDYYIGIGNYYPLGIGWRSYLALFDTSGTMTQIKTISLVLDTMWSPDYQALDIETIGDRIFWLGAPTTPYYPNSGGTTLIAFDANLDTLFTISSGLDSLYGLSKTNDDHLLLFSQGHTAKMDTAGTFLWTTPNSSPSFPNEFVETTNGGFASIGGEHHVTPFFGNFYHPFYPPNQTVYFNLYTNTGVLSGGAIYNPPTGIGKQLGATIVSTFDNGFAFVGISDQKIWLVKTDSSGSFHTGLNSFDDGSSWNVFPNPADKSCSFYSSSSISQIAVWDLLGNLVERKEINEQSYQLDVVHYPEAVYILELLTKTGTLSRMKLMVVH